MSHTEDNSATDQFHNNALESRIDAQLEAYRKITTDYNNIINDLDRLRCQIEELKKDNHEDYRNILNDLDRLGGVETQVKQVLPDLVKEMGEAIERRQEEIARIISSLESCLGRLQERIKFLADCYTQSKEDKDDEWSAALAELSQQLNVGCENLGGQITIGFQQVNDSLDANFDHLKEVPDNVAVVYDAILTTKKWRIRFYWVLAAVLTVTGIVETLCQLGIMKILWFSN